MTTPKHLQGKFAADTEVPVERSRAELESLLDKYGATSIGFLRDNTGAVLVFEMEGRRVRHQVTNPDPADFELTAGNAKRNAAQLKAAVDQETRRRWRVLVLVVKAKLELVATGQAKFQDEFLASIVLPNGDTVGDAIAPKLEQAYKTGSMPKLLLGSG